MPAHESDDGAALVTVAGKCPSCGTFHTVTGVPDTEPRRWRVRFTNRRQELRCFDVDAIWGPHAIEIAHERFRAEPGDDPMRGWWMKDWRCLNPPAPPQRKRWWQRRATNARGDA